MTRNENSIFAGQYQLGEHLHYGTVDLENGGCVQLTGPERIAEFSVRAYGQDTPNILTLTPPPPSEGLSGKLRGIRLIELSGAEKEVVTRNITQKL